MTYRLLLLCPALALAACGAPDADEAKPVPEALVRTAPAEAGTVSSAVTVYGATEAEPGSAHMLTTPSEAVVAAIDAPTGTPVTPGQAVVTLRPSPAARAEIARIASEAVATQAAYQRALRLRADSLASDGDVETARAAASTAEAARASYGMTANGLVLRAPVAGIVQGVTAKPGDQIAAGSALAGILAPGGLRARFGIDPALVGRIHIGQAIQVETADGAGTVSVPVAGLDPQIDPATRLAALFVRLPAALRLALGAPLRASLSPGGNAATGAGIVIPYATLLDDGGHSYVFVVAGGVAHRRAVLPGGSAGERIQIRGGLKPGERVVTEGGAALEDGMKVREGGAQ